MGAIDNGEDTFLLSTSGVLELIYPEIPMKVGPYAARISIPNSKYID